MHIKPDAFEGKQVLVIGDIMLDRYLSGHADRISPEAPVPVVTIEHDEYRLGGAANAALNIASLGARAFLCGVSGHDSEERILHSLLSNTAIESEGVIQDPSRPTTVKTRVLSRNQQMLRFDREYTHALSPALAQILEEKITAMLHRYDIHAVIFSDYDKGVLNPELIKHVISMCTERNIPTVADPKKRNFFAYRGITLFKPNLAEVNMGLGLTTGHGMLSLHEAENALNMRLMQDKLLITLGEHGVYWSDGKTRAIEPAQKRLIADVCGAGDAVAAVSALALACGKTIHDIAILANHAGGIVCSSPGVVPVSKAQFFAETNQS